ncbi:MAG: DUF4445 domain-containing protein [Lachnospiraceae bacterium]|nr:DUF4445 domain-containing protein [Lachnospiraceae bacterium]
MSTKITYHGTEKEIEIIGKKSILDLVRSNFECSFSACARSGSCGRCLCRLEREGEEARIVKACSTYALDGDRISCMFEEEYESGGIEVTGAEDSLHKAENSLHKAEIGLHKFENDSLHKTDIGLHNSQIGLHNDKMDSVDLEAEIDEKDLHNLENSDLHNSNDVSLHKPNYNSLHKVASIDLGSTTIAMALGQKHKGILNPQRPWGADVLSRIEASGSGDAMTLANVTRKALEKALKDLDDGEVKGALVSANTAMMHILMGYDCSGLGKAPFVCHSLDPDTLQLGKYTLYTLPGISAFIGADIVSGLYYLDSLTENQDNSTCYLLIDLGTNCEMVLKRDGKYTAVSAAAGSALDGDDELNLMGPDIISLVASALRQGAVDGTGLLADEYFETGIVLPIKDSGKSYRLTQKHIRGVQLMKAAVLCALDTLLESSAGRVDRVYISGGFGSHLEEDDCFEVRMLPESLRGRAVMVGNTSLLGAQKLAGVIEMQTEKAGKPDFGMLDYIIKGTRVIELPDMSDFGEKYINSINFE